jgi:hypothetical protein
MRILRILQSQSLPCRCFVGVYETYGGQTVRIVEEPGANCQDSLHRPGFVVDTSQMEPAPRSVDREPTQQS